MSINMTIETITSTEIIANETSPISIVDNHILSESEFITPLCINDHSIPSTPVKPEIDPIPSPVQSTIISNFIEPLDQHVDPETILPRNLNDEFIGCDYVNDETKSIDKISPNSSFLTDIPSNIDEEMGIDMETAIRLSLSASTNNEIEDESDMIEIIDATLGKFNIVNCDWGYNPDKFVDVSMYRDDRRRLRKPLTDKYDAFCIWCAFTTLLETAISMESRLSDDVEEKYYIFKPYNQSIGATMDDFSTRSYNREIGIKTTLNKEAANVILSIYYLFYMKFKQTSDETIFEDLYRECVLAQDSNFDLAKFNDRITTGENLKYFTALRSLMQACLDLTPISEELSEIRFNAWTICYSKQTSRVTSKNPKKFEGFKSIYDLMIDYNSEWLDNMLNDSSTKNEITLPPVKHAIFDIPVPVPPPAVNLDVYSSALIISEVDLRTLELNNSDNTVTTPLVETISPGSNNYNSSEIVTGIESVPATPINRVAKRNAPDTVGKLINGIIGLFISSSKNKDK